MSRALTDLDEAGGVARLKSARRAADIFEETSFCFSTVDADFVLSALTAKDALIAELVEALEATVPPESLGDGWWCPECRTAIDGASVTNDERCTGCGTSLTDHQPTGERLAKARAALARAKGEKS